MEDKKEEHQLLLAVMIISLTHPRIKAIKCWKELLDGCEKLSTFLSRVEKYAKIIEKSEETIFYDKFGEDGARAFKGDIAEILCEAILKVFGPAWGIYRYEPLFSLTKDNDVGVDGIAYTKDGRTTTIQIKYGNFAESLDYVKRKLRTFHFTSIFKYKVGIASFDQMFVFSLTRDIHWRTLNEFMHNRLKFITQVESGGVYSSKNKPSDICSLKSVCGFNPEFWTSFEKAVKV